MKGMKEGLKELINLHGAPGFENEVRDYLITKLEYYKVQHYKVDTMGNLLVRIEGKSENAHIVHLDAHMDELGFIVKYIDDNGYIYVAQLGGIGEAATAGQRVLIHTGKGSLVGVFGVKSFHVSSQEERRNAMLLEDMWIDVGASSKQEVLELGVRIGSPITIDVKMEELSNNNLVGKAFDDRVGCLVLLDLIKKAIEEPFDSTLYLSFSVQEEVFLRGSQTVFNSFKRFFGNTPKVSISYDIGIAGDYPGVKKQKANLCLGKGPGIKVYDKVNFTYQVVFPKLLNAIEDIAVKHNIPYQYDFLISGATNSNIFQTYDTGVLAGCISIPCRYTHSPIEIINLEDVENVIKLSKAFIEEFNHYLVIN